MSIIAPLVIGTLNYYHVRPVLRVPARLTGFGGPGGRGLSAKTAGPHGPAVFGHRWSALRFGDPRATLRVADRSPTPPLTSAACAVTVSVTVSGPTCRLSAAPLAETPLLF